MRPHRQMARPGRVFREVPAARPGRPISSPASKDFAGFPRGAVLVARTTNPAWTPLFYAAAALVTETGGPLSHGAVTAREARIPAVMAVRNILRLVKNGDMLRVDGTNGRVSNEA
jgi:rifampicin phosphotransferase